MHPFTGEPDTVTCSILIDSRSSPDTVTCNALIDWLGKLYRTLMPQHEKQHRMGI